MTGDDSQVANGFEGGSVDVRLYSTKFHLSNSEHSSLEVLLKRLN
jgi:hypothetical protein